jgi:SAM-dependent methyltransferase
LQPVCPRCRSERQLDALLALDTIAQQSGDHIIEATLRCSDTRCGQVYPVIDGIPVIVPAVEQYLKDNFYHLTARNDFSHAIESLLGEISGPGAVFNNSRHHLSSYGWDHYGDLAPEGMLPVQQGGVTPGNAVACLEKGLSLLGAQLQAPCLDIGCAVGRTTFQLASQGTGPVLGVDLNFWMLRTAQQVLRQGRLLFPLKRVGMVYDRFEFAVSLPGAEAVDFWACDARALPFAKGSFGFVNALNVFDVVSAPGNFLCSLRDSLRADGAAVLSTPYDWSPPVPVKHWIDGHEQGDMDTSTRDTILSAMLTPGEHPGAIQGLTVVGEEAHHPWHVRVHNRRTASYDTHIVACKKT